MEGADSLAPRLAALGHVMHAFGIDDGDVQALERPPQDGPAPRPVLHGATLLLPDAPPEWALNRATKGAAPGEALLHDLHLAAVDAEGVHQVAERGQARGEGVGAFHGPPRCGQLRRPIQGWPQARAACRGRR
jgi:hypothetical protein